MESLFQSHRLITVIIGLFLSVPAWAIETGARLNGNSVKLEPSKVVSVIYSKTLMQALVGVVESNGTARFLNCQVPAVGDSVKLYIDVLFSCEDVPGTTFFVEEGTIRAINSRFPEFFQQSFEKNMTALAESSRPVASAIAVGGSGVIIGLFSLQIVQSGFTQIKNPRFTARSMGAAKLGLGFLGVAFGAVSIGAGVWNLVRDYPIAPIEDALQTQVQKLVLAKRIQSSPVEFQQLTDGLATITFKTLVEALQSSIYAANSF